MSKKMFDFVIGNPPFQQDMQDTSDTPVYHEFMDETYKIATSVELITPARFLFDAGKTPKAWNQKMLNDKHLKVLMYEPDIKKVFPSMGFKGGVAVTIRDSLKNYGAIEMFISEPILRSLKEKVVTVRNFTSINTIIFSPESYKFSENLYIDHPEIKTMTKFDKKKNTLVSLISKGHDYDLTTNVFDNLYNIVFFDDKPNDNKKYASVEGRLNNVRKRMFIEEKYIKNDKNFSKWKVFLPKSNGSGTLGETLSTPLVGEPLVGHTQTYLSFGAFDTAYEANSCFKYIKTKFARVMLGILKVTQDNKAGTWRYVPLQDFTSNSDIDWSKSIHEIDLQLYKKYGLDDKEIEFIETHVKEME